MSKFLESLKEVEKGFIIKESKEVPVVKKYNESKKEVAEIFSDAISVALLQVEEKLGEKFDNVDEAKQFVNAIWNFLNNDNENVFNGALERFQRARKPV